MSNETTTRLTEETARQAIQEYQQKTGKSQNAIAKELSISGAALSQFLSGVYKGVVQNIVEAIEQLLKISTQREVTPKKPGFRMISASQQVTSLITQCHVQGELGVAYGDPGVGKTMAIRQYARENQDAIVITVSPTSATISGVNELIADKLKIKEKLNRRITTEIVTKLKGSKRIIIIDEAQHLKARVVNHLRGIVDATEDEDTGERIGMALIGNDEIYTELKVRQAAAYGQVADRVVRWAHIVANATKLEDIKMIFSNNDALIEDNAITFLHQISTNVSLRTAVHVYTNTLIVFQIKDSKTITAEKLARVAKEMHLRVAG